MEQFVRVTAPTGKTDFVMKLAVLILIAGCLNHLRDVVTDGFAGAKPFIQNFADSLFTALPMCAFALMLIGHLNSLQKRLYLQATRDLLTELPNRRWFMDKTPTSIKPSQVMMIIDIDHFKNINDSFGHDVGDLCLQQMAQHLRGCLDDRAKLARIGGEEFAVFMTGCGLPAISTVAKNISDGFQFETGQVTAQQVTASVGFICPDVAMARSEAMKLADQAVYRAKASGRACFAMAPRPVAPVMSKSVSMVRQAG